MSGHSKWNNIKRTKEKSDAAKGKIFTKLVREISVAIKTGGADIETNSRLKDAVFKARQNNMPNDSINRNIKKFSGEDSGVNYEEIIYEGYGTGGIAVLVVCLTDNRNRTASDVRHAFDKFGGSLGTTGSVSYLFSKQGVIVLSKSNVNYDKLFETVLNNDGLDIEEVEDNYIITTDVSSFSNLQSILEKENYEIVNADIEFVPSTTIELDEQKKNTFEKMIDSLEELDDVSQVYHNAVF